MDVSAEKPSNPWKEDCGLRIRDRGAPSREVVMADHKGMKRARSVYSSDEEASAIR